jgi:hypothetical protein
LKGFNEGYGTAIIGKIGKVISQARVKAGRFKQEEHV